MGVKPQTTVLLTDMGRDSFIEYLKALEEVLQKAAEAITTGEEGYPALCLDQTAGGFFLMD